MQSWLEGRIWVGKGAQATGMSASLRIQSSKADSNTCESFTRSGLKLESVHQESPRSDVFRKRATKPLLKQRQRQKHLTWAVEKNNWTVAQWSKVLFSDESTFCISFGNQGPRVWRKSGEAQNPCCLKSSVKFPQSVIIWAAMSSAGVGPLCFLKSTVNAAIYQEILEHFMLPSADKLYGDADFIFQQDLAPVPHCQRYQKLFNDSSLWHLNGGGRIFFAPRPRPYFPSLPALLSRLVIERLSLHCSPNWKKIMDLINWSLNAIDTIFSTRSSGSGEPNCPDGTFTAGYTMDAVGQVACRVFSGSFRGGHWRYLPIRNHDNRYYADWIRLCPGYRRIEKTGTAVQSLTRLPVMIEAVGRAVSIETEDY